MIVIGGFDGSITLPFMHFYNSTTNIWTPAPSFPESKSLHFSFYTGNMIMVFGGKNVPLAGLPSPNWSNSGYRYFLTPTVSSATALTVQDLFLYKR